MANGYGGGYTETRQKASNSVTKGTPRFWSLLMEGSRLKTDLPMAWIGAIIAAVFFAGAAAAFLMTALFPFETRTEAVAARALMEKEIEDDRDAGIQGRSALQAGITGNTQAIAKMTDWRSEQMQMDGEIRADLAAIDTRMDELLRASRAEH